MRAAESLDHNVNVHDRALKASGRVGTNGRLHGIGLGPQPPTPSWFDRLFKPEKLVVEGREVKGFVVPHWAAGVLLAAILTAFGFLYSQLTSQRDMLIRLDTQLQERAQHESEYRHNFENKLELEQVYINDLNKQVVSIKASLTPAQIRAIESQRMEH